MNEARFREIEEEQINRIKFCRIKLLRNGHVGTHTLMGGLPIICLLYTSDAADE